MSSFANLFLQETTFFSFLWYHKANVSYVIQYGNLRRTSVKKMLEKKNLSEVSIWCCEMSKKVVESFAFISALVLSCLLLQSNSVSVTTASSILLKKISWNIVLRIIKLCSNGQWGQTDASGTTKQLVNEKFDFNENWTKRVCGDANQ